MNSNELHEVMNLIVSALGENRSRIEELYTIENEIFTLQDKLHRRNMQIKELKEKIEHFKNYLHLHLNSRDDYQEALRVIKNLNR